MFATSWPATVQPGKTSRAACSLVLPVFLVLYLAAMNVSGGSVIPCRTNQNTASTYSVFYGAFVGQRKAAVVQLTLFILLRHSLLVCFRATLGTTAASPLRRCCRRRLLFKVFAQLHPINRGFLATYRCSVLGSVALISVCSSAFPIVISAILAMLRILVQFIGQAIGSHVCKNFRLSISSCQNASLSRSGNRLPLFLWFGILVSTGWFKVPYRSGCHSIRCCGVSLSQASRTGEGSLSKPVTINRCKLLLTFRIVFMPGYLPPAAWRFG